MAVAEHASQAYASGEAIGLPSGFHATDPQIYGRRVPRELFAKLRRSAPIWWNPQRRGADGFNDEGFWVVSKHDDIKDISRRSDIFSSHLNGAIPRLEEGISAEEFESTKTVLISQDAPEHTKLRNLVSRLFTPRGVAALRDVLEQRAERIVRAALVGGEGEFVREVASELPMQAIGDLLGFPEEDRARLFDWSNQMTGYNDNDITTDSRQGAAEILGYSYQIAEQRRLNPTDDIISRLVLAEIDGQTLTPEQFGFFVIMLGVAGNETTRNATTLGMLAFLDNPDQWELFKTQRPQTTADEIVRYTSPLICLQRTAACDTEVNGTEIKAGQRLVLMYTSANFDEDVFDDPLSFNILRNPNPHIGFGGTGAHYCLGANLARLELDIIFNKIADHMPDVSAIGDPQRLHSGWLSGVKHWRAHYGRAAQCPVAY
jgi:cholest-4-en-3-one 26-monooxygenase